MGYTRARDNQGFDMGQCSQQSVKALLLLLHRSRCISQLPMQKHSQWHKIIIGYQISVIRSSHGICSKELKEAYIYIYIYTVYYMYRLCTLKNPMVHHGSHQRQRLRPPLVSQVVAAAAWTRHHAPLSPMDLSDP